MQRSRKGPIVIFTFCVCATMTDSNRDPQGEGLADSWFVYVIRNSKGALYTGCAKGNVESRVAKHNANVGAKYTRGRGPWEIVFCNGPFLDRGAAQRHERQIKSDRRFKAMLKANFFDAPQ